MKLPATDRATLTDAQRDRMSHALGVGRDDNRNFYAAGGDDIAIWDELVAKGFAVRRRQSPLFPDICFSVTDAGRAALSLAGDKQP